MNAVRVSKFGDGMHSVNYSVYLTNVEYRDLKAALVFLFVPSADEVEEDHRILALSHFDSNEIKRLQNLTSQICMQL